MDIAANQLKVNKSALALITVVDGRVFGISWWRCTMDFAKDQQDESKDSYLERRAKAALSLIRKKSDARRSIEDEKRKSSPNHSI